MKNTVSLLIILSAFVTSCASVHPGEKTKSSVKDDKVTVSINENKDLSDKYYIFMEYTFQNNSDKWVDADIKQLSFIGEDTEVLIDDKLNAWVEGAELKLKRKNYNKSVILASVVGVSGIIGSTSSNGNLKMASAVATIGAVGVAANDGIRNTLQDKNSGLKGLNQTVNVPKSYILAPFKIAPESYVRKWVVIKRPEKGIKRSQSAKTEIIDRKNYRFIKGVTINDIGEEVKIQDAVEGTKLITISDINGKNTEYTFQY